VGFVVLQRFAHENGLTLEKLVELERGIREAKEDRSLGGRRRGEAIAWDGLLVFALYSYFEVTDMAELAEATAMGVSTVKRWVSGIYKYFGLDEADFPRRTTRRKQLRVEVVRLGFQRYPSWLHRILEDRDG
jgi:hypothetical protein